MNKEKIRWGIIGAGNISSQFAKGLASARNGELVAVAARSQGKAAEFAARYGTSKSYGSYEALVADPNVDAIYVGTIHPMHKPHTLLALNAGKHVLCEKPFAINEKEARQMIATAKQNGLFLMEAMWSRFLPAYVKVRQLIDEGAIGDVRMIQADFGFRTEVNPTGRLFDRQQGGGALLDVGIYPLSLASMISGEPTRISALADIGTTGVDEQAAVIFGYDKGQLALLSGAIRTQTPHEAFIMGTNGRIKIHAPFWNSCGLTLVKGEKETIIDCPAAGNGYNYQAEEVGHCVRRGLQQSPIMSWDETLALMRTMDTIRAQWGLVYPEDEA